MRRKHLSMLSPEIWARIFFFYYNRGEKNKTYGFRAVDRNGFFSFFVYLLFFSANASGLHLLSGIRRNVSYVLVSMLFSEKSHPTTQEETNAKQSKRCIRRRMVCHGHRVLWQKRRSHQISTRQWSVGKSRRS